MPVVRMPDGVLVNFPDDMPREEIKGLIASKFPELAASAAPEEDTSLLGYVPETFKAIGAGGAGMLESALTGAAFLLPEEQEQAARARIAEIGGGVQEFLAPDEAYEGTYLDLMRGVGSTLPFLATGFFGAPGLVAGATMGVGAGAGEAAQRATAAGATEEEISTAAGYGMIPGAFEMVGPARIIRRARRALGGNTEEVADALNNSFKSRLARVSEGRLGRVTRAAMEEAAQEASSEVLQNLISQGVYDPDTGTFEGVGESAKIGGGVGGILQLFTDLIVGGNRRVGRAEGDGSVFEDEPAAETPAPSTLERQDSLTVLSANDLEGLGLDLDKATADKLFGLDLADPEQKTQARRILTNYRNNKAVQNNKPQTVSRIDSLLRSEIFQEPEEAVLRKREELPLEERIRVRPPAEVQPDLIDIAETEQIQEALDEEELAQMQAEEDAQLASQEKAKSEVAAVQQEMELGEADRRVAERREMETAEKRRQVLLPILGREDITDAGNIGRAFSAELRRQGFTDTEPTQDELAAITRRSYELEQAAGVETAQAAEQAAGTAGLEALIPERRTTPAAPELTEQELQRAEKARLNREQMDSVGRGVEGQLEIPAIERPERAAARAAEPEATVAETPKAQKVNKVFFDKLNVAPAAPIRRRTQGMDTDSPEFRAELTNFARSARVPEQTKININNFLQASPEAAAQQDLFAPTTPRRTIYERDVARRREERAAKKVTESTTTAPETTAPTPVAPAAPAAPAAPEPAPKKAAPLKEEAKPSAPPRVRARAKKAATTPLEKVQATKVTKNNKYTPEGAMKGYLDLADQDIDLALREIAFDAVVPKESTIKSVTARRQSKSARKWVEENMPENVPALEALTEEATTEETKRVQEDLRRSPKRRADNVAARKKKEAADLGAVKSYINPKEDIAENDSLTMEVVDDVIDFQNEPLRAPEEVELDVDKAALREQLDIDMAAFEGDVNQYLRADAVAATMATADASVAEAVNRGSVLNALGAIFKTSKNSQVRSVATALAKAIKTAGGVRVTVVEDLTDSRGNQLAGVYDESTDTILINKAIPVSTHVVLHEAGHAATAQVLNNPSHPTTVALTKLYNDLKESLPDEYGMTSLKDFVAEAFVNPEFQAKLAAFKPKGQPKTAWDKFWSAVGRLFGIDTASANTEVQELINTLLATAPNTRKVTTVPSAIAKGNNAEAATHLMSNGKDFLKDAPPNTAEEIFSWGSKTEQRVRANFLNGVGLEAITDLLKIKIPEAKDVEKILYKIDGARVEGMKTYNALRDDIIKAFKGSPTDKKTYNQLVSFSTINKIDPTIDEDRVKKHWLVYGERDSSGNLVRKEVSFDTKAKMGVAKRRLEDRLEREKAANPDNVSLTEIEAIEPTNENIANYEEAKRLYTSLSTSTQRAAYTKLRDFYKDINDQIIAAEESNIEKLELDKGAKKTIRDTLFLKRLKTGFIDPYFPLTRSGDNWLEFSYTDDNGQTVYGTGSFDTELQRDRAMAKLKDLPNVDENTVRKRSLAEIQTKTYDNSIPIPFLTDLRKQIQGLEVKDAAAKKQVDEFLADLTLRALPDQSLIQSRMVRQNIAFFEGDAVESFDKRGPQFVNSLANLTYLVDLENAGRVVREKRDALPESEELAREAATIVAGTKEETGRMQAFGSLPSYVQFSKNPFLPEYARWMRAGTFVWTLGANISSTVVNASIIPIVLQSRLSGQYGPLRATKATSRASALYASSFGKTSREGLEGEVRELGGFSTTNDFSQDPKKEAKFAPIAPLNKLFKERGIDTRTISGETSQIDNPVTPWINKLSYYSGFLFNHSERAIRQISAISTYILEIENLVAKARGVKEGSVAFKDITPEEINTFGEQAAETAIDTTTYVNTSALLTTAPRVAQTGVGSLIWQYKRVPGQFLYTHLSMIKTLFDDMTGKARNEAEREEARVLRNTFFYLTATGAALVGVKGIPMYGTAVALMNLFLEDDEDDANTIIAKMIGEDKYYGLIASMAGIDITDRIALTNLMVRDRGNYKPNSQIEGLLESWLGPTYGVGTRAAGGFIDLFSDDPKNKDRAIEAILPTGASNVVKSYRFATKGYETGRGDAIITGELPAGDVFKQALGFSPISTRAARDKLSVNIRKDRGRKERRSRIIEKITYGLQNDRPELVTEGYSDAAEYNADHPSTAIKASTIAQSISGKARRSATARITGGAPVDRNVLNEILESNREFEEGLD